MSRRGRLRIADGNSRDQTQQIYTQRGPGNGAAFVRCGLPGALTSIGSASIPPAAPKNSRSPLMTAGERNCLSIEYADVGGMFRNVTRRR